MAPKVVKKTAAVAAGPTAPVRPPRSLGADCRQIGVPSARQLGPLPAPRACPKPLFSGRTALFGFGSATDRWVRRPHRPRCRFNVIGGFEASHGAAASEAGCGFCAVQRFLGAGASCTAISRAVRGAVVLTQ